MINVKEKLIKLIEEIPEPDVEEVLYYLEHIKKQQGLSFNQELDTVCEINIESWDNDVYEEVLEIQ